MYIMLIIMITNKNTIILTLILPALNYFSLPRYGALLATALKSLGVFNDALV